jgi:hypothetical protein
MLFIIIINNEYSIYKYRINFPIKSILAKFAALFRGKKLNSNLEYVNRHPNQERVGH